MGLVNQLIVLSKNIFDIKQNILNNWADSSAPFDADV